ncbi:MAG: tetrathionate reductase family octaheme c-type cytochrome [Anaerolineae bacterium]|nr:tetrathionate reductase family octaheme c-type cytochrome [Anaerolineae bacterium]
MRSFRYIWVLGLVGTFLLVAGVIILALTPNNAATASAWDSLPTHPAHTDHTELMPGPYEDGPSVTRACLTCHEDAAHEVMQTVHWTWQSPPVEVAWSEEPVSIGKANTLNNFCIGVQSNWQGCTRCHAGYGWNSADFDFSNSDNVDCLVCHDQSGAYVKAGAGLPAEGVDLAAAAQSVGVPTRVNCGSCHFNGGGGNGVKHGDLDESLYFPSENLDVHMGRADFLCTDCHRTEDHNVAGRSISVSVDDANQIYCTDCHEPTTLHEDERITAHLDSVACQTCHIPTGARRDPTKMEWDWSAAGDPNREEDPHEYLRIKGSFVYEENFTPEYAWYNGTGQHYLLGDEIDPESVTMIDQPLGSIDDPSSLIFPFKVHRANQPYDTVYNILLQPQTVGETGYWTTFDWDSALRNGAVVAGIPYSGNFGFTDTAMYWPITHMVQPADYALQCTDCHSDNGRMDWQALGYYGDPMEWGGRRR